MLANFFGKSKPVNFIFILGLFFGYSFLAFYNHQTNFSFLEIGGVVSTFLLIFFLYNFIVVKNNLTFDNSYAFLFFVIFLGFFPSIFFYPKTLLIFVLLLFSYRKIYSLKSESSVFQKLFDAGFWLGITYVIEPFSVVNLLLLYIAIYVFGKLTLQTLIIPIIGFITPLIIYFTYCFWNDSITDFSELFYWITTYDFSELAKNYYLIPSLILAIFGLFSLVLKTPKALSVNNSFKRSWLLLIFNLLVATAYILFIKERNGSEIIFVLFPLSIIIANGLEMIEKKWLKESFLLSLLVCSIVFSLIY